MKDTKENAVVELRKAEYRLLWVQASLAQVFRAGEHIGYIRRIPALSIQRKSGNEWATLDTEFWLHDVNQYSNPLNLDCAIRYLIVESSLSRVQIEITQEFVSGHVRTQTLKQIQMKGK